jgi:hypothetical protein
MKEGTMTKVELYLDNGIQDIEEFCDQLEDFCKANGMKLNIPPQIQDDCDN